MVDQPHATSGDPDDSRGPGRGEPDGPEVDDGEADDASLGPIELDVDSDDEVPRWVRRVLVWIVAIIVALYFARGILTDLRPFLVILLISFFLSFAIEPTVNRLEARGIRRGIGTWIVFLGVLLTATGFGFAIGTVLADQITELADNVPGYLEDIEVWLDDTFGIEVDTEELQRDWVEQGGAQELASNFSDDLVNWGTTLLNVLLQIFTIALFTYYLVAEGPKLRRTVCSVLPPARQREVLQVWDLAIEKTGGYIASRAVLAVVSGLAHWAALAIIGVPFPLPLAMWVGVMSQFIPVVGTYLAGALPVLIALLDDPSKALWVLAFVVVYQQIENYLLAPRITAHTMEIHVAVAFGGVIVGGALMGPIGAVLALPAVATGQAFASTYIRRYEVVAQPRRPRRRDRGQAPGSTPTG